MRRNEIVLEHQRQYITNANGCFGGYTKTEKSKSSNFTQFIAALAVSFGPLAAGLGKGYASPAIANLQELQIRVKGNLTIFSVNDQEASWIASLSLLGALFGGLIGGVAMQFGRKKILALTSLPFSLAWIITVFATTVETMFITAFLGGMCCSVVSMVTQVYVSEISSPEIRGLLSAIQKMSGHLGVLISFSLGAYLDWRQLAMLISIAPVTLFLTIIYIPETPSYLILKKRHDEAFSSLQWLRGPEKNIEFEFETIKYNIHETTVKYGLTTKGFDFKELYEIVRHPVRSFKNLTNNSKLIRPLFITCGLMMFQRFTGANLFGFYAVTIFRQTFAGLNPHGGAIAVSFVQLLSSMLSGLLIDFIGRVPLLITSSVFMSLALASFGSYIYYEHATRALASKNIVSDVIMENTDWIPLLCVFVFTIAFSLGISPISSLLVGEIFPLEYRSFGSSTATSFSYFCAFINVKTFIDFQQSLGLYGAFWLYACMSCLGLLFIVTCVPETKGKDLDEMNPNYVTTYKINR